MYIYEPEQNTKHACTFEILKTFDVQGERTHDRNHSIPNYLISKYGIDFNKSFTDNFRRILTTDLVSREKGYTLFELDEERHDFPNALVKILNEVFFIKFHKCNIARVSKPNLEFEVDVGKQRPGKDHKPLHIRQTYKNIDNKDTIVVWFDTPHNQHRLGAIENSQLIYAFVIQNLSRQIRRLYYDSERGTAQTPTSYLPSDIAKKHMINTSKYKLLISDKMTRSGLLRKAFTEKYMDNFRSYSIRSLYQSNEHFDTFLLLSNDFITKDLALLEPVYNSIKKYKTPKKYFTDEMSELYSAFLMCEEHLRENDSSRNIIETEIENSSYIGTVNHQNMKLSLLYSPIEITSNLFMLDAYMENERYAHDFRREISRFMDESTLDENNELHAKFVSLTKTPILEQIKHLLPIQFTYNTMYGVRNLYAPILSYSDKVFIKRKEKFQTIKEILYKSSPLVRNFEENILFIITFNRYYANEKENLPGIIAQLLYAHNKKLDILLPVKNILNISPDHLDIFYTPEAINLPLYLEIILSYIYLFYMMKNIKNNQEILEKLETIIDNKIQKFNDIVNLMRQIGKFIKVGFIHDLQPITDETKNILYDRSNNLIIRNLADKRDDDFSHLSEDDITSTCYITFLNHYQMTHTDLDAQLVDNIY